MESVISLEEESYLSLEMASTVDYLLEIVTKIKAFQGDLYFVFIWIFVYLLAL